MSLQYAPFPGPMNFATSYCGCVVQPCEPYGFAVEADCVYVYTHTYIMGAAGSSCASPIHRWTKIFKTKTICLS